MTRVWERVLDAGTEYNFEEYCPHCDSVVPIIIDNDDRETYEVVCPECGHAICLCTLCRWDDEDAETHHACDWNAKTRDCWRCPKHKTIDGVRYDKVWMFYDTYCDLTGADDDGRNTNIIDVWVPTENWLTPVPILIPMEFHPTDDEPVGDYVNVVTEHVETLCSKGHRFEGRVLKEKSK